MNLSKSELQVLSILWDDQPLTVGQIIERVQMNTDWHDNTIKTLLTRLTEKGAVDRYKDGRRFFYVPVTQREDVIEDQTKGLLSRFFGGRMAPLVAHFAEQKKLSKKDIRELEEILERLKDNDH